MPGQDPISGVPHEASAGRGQRPDAAGLRLRPDRAGRAATSTRTSGPSSRRQQMLELGVFGGKYMTDCARRVPRRLVREREALPRAARPGAELLRRERLAAARRCGARRAGSTPTIRAAGSSGTAATTWAGAAPTTSGRSAVAGHPAARRAGRRRTAAAATWTAAAGSGRRCCTGRTTRGRFEKRLNLRPLHRNRHSFQHRPPSVRGSNGITRRPTESWVGFYKVGSRQAEHHLARVGRRGPVLRLDRRRSQER